MKHLAVAVFCGIIGLTAGYFVFGKFGGELIPIKQFFSASSGIEGLFNKLGNSLIGIEEIRNKILISGGVGALLGLILPFLGKKR